MVAVDSIRVDPNKISVITECKVPKNVFEVHRFLGLVGYYRCFIKNISIIASPLTKLLQKDVAFVWTNKC